MCAIEGNYSTFYNLLSIYCSKNVSFRIILLTNSQSRFCPWCTGSSRNSTPLMVSFPQICTLDWRTVPYRKTKPGSGSVVYSYLGPTLAGFFGGKARAVAPCFFCTCFRCRNHMMQDMLWRCSLSKQTRARLYNFYCFRLENPCHLRRWQVQRDNDHNFWGNAVPHRTFHKLLVDWAECKSNLPCCSRWW